MLDNLDDLAPDMLWVKFDRTYKAAGDRKGNYTEWVAAHY